MSELESHLKKLRPNLAEAAQTVIDGWVQDDEGYDDIFGSGGACDAVAQAMTSVIVERLGEDVSVTDGGHDGDDHAYIIVYDATEAFAVDVPPEVYETGGGYQWRKIKDAKVSANDITIQPVDRQYVADW